MRTTAEQEAEIVAARAARSETRRPTVPDLEALLYEVLPALDHGFVRVVDYMGDDAAIVQAARVSYGRGTRRVNEDRGLIRYLMRHHHTTPFEMCELKLHCKLPIFVARQWIRHRTACLTGDTILSFDLPGAGRRGRRQHHGMPLQKLHRLWHEGLEIRTAKRKPLFTERVDPAGRYTVPELARLVERRQETIRGMIRDGQVATEDGGGRLRITGAAWHAWARRSPSVSVPMRDRLARMRLRSCNEESGAIEHTGVLDVWSTGVRPVFRVTLQNGYSLRMTEDHRCLTERGWMTLREATGLRLRDDGGVTWSDGAPAFAVNGVAPHRSREWLTEQRARGAGVAEMAFAAGVSYHTIRKALSLHKLQFDARERAALSGAAQRGQRRTLRRRSRSPEAAARVSAARSGPASNFWKGGMTAERALIAAWTRQHAAQVHARHEFRCIVCGGKDHLHAHHLDPIWHNVARSRDLENLVSLCRPCHSAVHRGNLELTLLEAVQNGEELARFWERHAEPLDRPVAKTGPEPRRLWRAFSRVERIDFAGQEETYDLAVSGPFHNFVANGLIVHNSVNEYSARYSILDREFYVPTPELVGAQSTSNRQGRADALTPERAAAVIALLRDDAMRCYDHYQELLNEDDTGSPLRPDEAPLARELARINLTLGYYTQWYWKIDLHNLFHFVQLRADPHAQEEIRVYARVIGDVVRRWVPAAWEAFVDYRLEATSLSRAEREAVRRLLAGEAVDLAALGLSKREQDELQAKLGREPA